MSLLSDLISKNKVEDLPCCEFCNINEDEQRKRDGDRPFLVVVREKLVCGRCAVKLLTKKLCLNCGNENIGYAKFCINCGGEF